MKYMKFLFISHAEKDSKLIKAFVELLYHIGLKPENIFCSSISGIDVPMKEDIYDYLRNLLDSEEIIPVFMLSENYYTSAACLNEMGAVWLKQKDYYTFLLPGFSFKEIRGAIDPNKRAIKLDNLKKTLQKELTLFKNSLCTTFDIENISHLRWEQYRDEFIDFLNLYDTPQKQCLDIAESKAYCIGETDSDACKCAIDSARDTIVFNYDFRQTHAKLCSLVLYTGGLNLQKQFKAGGRLEFELRTTDESDITVELHSSSMTCSKQIMAQKEWQSYSIALTEFSNLHNAWTSCSEVCFVIGRRFLKHGTVELRNIYFT